MHGCYKWYVLQVKSGSEEAVLKMIGVDEHDEGFVKEVFVPTNKNELSKKGGKSKLLPGYLFVKMNMNKVHLRNILSIPSVTRFLGDSMGAKVVSDAEVEKIKNNIDKLHTPDKMSPLIQVGDEVKIIDGPFQSFVGKVEVVDSVKDMVRVLIVVFGRSTPIDLEKQKIEKVS